jgi:endonuclease/exonuclease/phosphatase family metal-dependent hydrolase
LLSLRFSILSGLFCLAFLLSSGCRASTDDATDGGTSADASTDFLYPEPRTDVVPSVGTEQTLEVATWNIENYPKNDSTPAVLANLIASLDLDIVALQEVQDIAAFNELVERLRGYEGMLSSHTYGDGTYQKVGYVYRTELVSMTGAFLLFSQQGYEFPRPPFKVDVTVDNGSRSFTFTSIALHLKAGGGFSDRQRREEAVVLLEDHMRTTIDGTGNGSIMVLGDFNDTLAGAGANVFSPLSSSGDLYTIRTTDNSTSGDISFVPSSVLLDHIVTSAELDAELPGSAAIIPRLDMQMTGYVGQVSDHLPVIVRVPL